MNLKLIKKDVICFPGGDWNLDSYGFKNNYFWVIDGATSLLEPYDPTDVIGMVNLINRLINDSIENNDYSLKDLMKIVTLEFNNYRIKKNYEELWEMPSCCIGIIKLLEEGAEYFLLGDITIVFRSENTKVISDKRVALLDQIAIEEKKRLQTELGLTSVEARKKIMPILRKHRSKMNSPEGYWIFNGDIDAVENALTGYVAFNGNCRILMSTDGFSRIVNVFQLYSSWEDVLNALKNKTLDELLKQLREVEKNDMDCLKYPRFSTYDDATAIYLEVSK